MAAGDIVVGLDIGTTKVCAVVGELTESGEIAVTGHGLRASRGVKKGVIVDLEGTVRAVEDAIIAAEEATDVDIDSVFVSFSGQQIESFESRGVIALPGQNREIKAEDKEMAIDAARAVELPANREILHVIPLDFSVDGQSGIREPVGMIGTQLEVAAHIVTCPTATLRNTVKAVKGAGLAISSVVLQSLASAEAALSPDEMELGVAVVDIGGGSTDLAVFEGGLVRHTAVLQMGGENVTNDIAICLSTPPAEAERLKIAAGTVDPSAVRPEEDVEFLGLDGLSRHKRKRSELAEVIASRMEEILSLVREDLARAGVLERIPAGIVLTGGGARVAGLPAFAERVTGKPARVGGPARMRELNETTASPSFSTAIGLLVHGHKIQQMKKASMQHRGSVVRRTLHSIGDWLRDLF